jgi:hypothetical protein
LASRIDPDRIDCHVHAGLERRESLEFAFAVLRNDRREIVGMLDHAELYMKEPPPWADLALIESARRVDEPGLVDLFRKRLRGPDVFYRQVRSAIASHGQGMRVAVALEVSGASLTKVDPAWLDGADFLGICTTQPSGSTGWGEHMASLLTQADRLRGGRRMGIVLHHPFRWRLLDLVRAGVVDPPPAAGFTEADAATTAAALADAGAVAEINYASYFLLRNSPGLIRAAREAFALLKEKGVRFSLGSDAHWLSSPQFEYRPAVAIEAFGLTPDDVELAALLDAGA